MDKRVFVLGLAMVVIGFSSYAYLNQNVPTGKADMSDDEKAALAQAEVVNVGLGNSRTCWWPWFFHFINQHRFEAQEKGRRRKINYAKACRDITNNTLVLF
jgi:zona occludens toxin (predicted ATPase)